MKTLEKIIQNNFSSAEQADIRLKAEEKIATIRLQQIRKAQQKTQKEMAQAMGVSQSALSELERRPNITIRAMQRYVEALGGKLRIKVEFPNNIRITYQGGSADCRNQFPGRYNPLSIKYPSGMAMPTHLILLICQYFLRALPQSMAS